MFHPVATRRENLMPGMFSPMHLIQILIIVLIVFGPGKLPDVAKALGGAFRNFKDAASSDDGKESLGSDKDPK